MTCIPFKLGNGTVGIASLGDERIYCFFFRNRWHRFSFSERWGPMKVDLIGELLQEQDWTKDRRFVKAFEVWVKLPKKEKKIWEAATTKCKADEYGYQDTAYIPSDAARMRAHKCGEGK